MQSTAEHCHNVGIVLEPSGLETDLRFHKHRRILVLVFRFLSTDSLLF